MMWWSGGIGGPNEDYPTRLEAIIATNFCELELTKGTKLEFMTTSVVVTRRDRETGVHERQTAHTRRPMIQF